MLILKTVNFMLEKIGIKFDAFKLKKTVDFSFVIVEKIIVKLCKLQTFYLDFYNEMVDTEIKLSSISKYDKILHVGCGPIPATSILLAKKMNASVTGIDKDIILYKHAKKCISNQDFSDKIQILHANALDFPMETFDVIIVSQGVKPSNQILKNIAGRMKNNCRVVYRTSSYRNGKLTDNDVFIKDIFSVREMIHHKKNALLISVLLLKK